VFRIRCDWSFDSLSHCQVALHFDRCFWAAKFPDAQFFGSVPGKQDMRGLFSVFHAVTTRVCSAFVICINPSFVSCLYYCNTMSASLLIDQRKILFYKKTICGSNVVLRTVCSLYFNAIQILSSAYNILPWHTSYIDVKTTFWSFFTLLLSI